MSGRKQFSRRRFVKGAAGAAAVFTIVPRRVLGGPAYTPPSEEITKAVVGVGGMGRGHLSYSFSNSRLLAVCDVDENHLKAALEAAGNGVDGYRDFREVLDRPDIDVIHVPTPPHWHALISIAAAEAGKDVWCEKPMSRTIGEGKKVIEAIQRNGRVFRLNTWFRFQSGLYGFGSTAEPIKKLVSNGVFGWPIRMTVGETTGFGWKFYWSGRTNLEPQPIPAALDYDMWLGPAPWKPYHPHRTHGTFRGYWDYDGGGLGDMGQHYLDPAQYIMGKDHTSPVEIEVDAPQQDTDAVTSWRWVRMRYDDGCELYLDGEGGRRLPFVEGPKGKLFAGFESDIPNLRRIADSLPDPEPMITDFNESIRTRRPFALNESNGHRSCTLINLAKIAVRLGRNLRFDPVKQEFIDDEGANRLVNQPMRAPWHL